MSLHGPRARQLVTYLGVLGLVVFEQAPSVKAGLLAPDATEPAAMVAATLELAADEATTDPAAEGGAELVPDAPVEGEPSVNDPVVVPPEEDGGPDAADPQKPVGPSPGEGAKD